MASARGDDRSILRALLQGTHWAPVESTNWSEVIERLESVLFPVVLYDRDLPGLEWQKGVPALAASSACCVILLSDVFDPYLWDELVNRRGFDVLTRPFRKADVLSVLDFAHTYWKLRGPDTHKAAS